MEHLGSKGLVQNSRAALLSLSAGIAIADPGRQLVDKGTTQLCCNRAKSHRSGEENGFITALLWVWKDLVKKDMLRHIWVKLDAYLASVNPCERSDLT